MDEDTSKTLSIDAHSMAPELIRHKTFPLRLATSLKSQAERAAMRQGVSLTYLITKALEEKFARMKAAKEQRSGAASSDNGPALVSPHNS